MLKRLKPEDIKAGSSYLLRLRHAIAKPIIRKVIRIEGKQIWVDINGEERLFTLKAFADLAVEEIKREEAE